MVDLAIIILSFNTKDLTKKCLDSIFEKNWKTNFKVVVVDNNSTDGSPEMIKQGFPKVKLLENQKNVGFAKGNNQAIGSIDAKYYLLLNSDTIVLEGSLDNLVQFIKASDFGIVSCKLIYEDQTFQPNVGELPYFWPVFNWLSGLDDLFKGLVSYHANHIRAYSDGKEVGWVSGSVMMIKKEVLDSIGLFDDKIFMYAEDVDFCWRAKNKGFKIGWTNQAEIIHLGGGSSKRAKLTQWRGEFRGLLYFYKKHFGVLAAFGLKLLIYFFVILRMMAFFIIGKFDYSKTYGQILISI